MTCERCKRQVAQVRIRETQTIDVETLDGETACEGQPFPVELALCFECAAELSSYDVANLREKLTNWDEA